MEVHHIRRDSRSITFPSLRRSDRLTALCKQTKQKKCQSLHLKTTAVCSECYLLGIQTSSRGCWRLCGPVNETHLTFFFFPYITCFFFFSLSLSHCTRELPQSSLYIPVVVMATGQHLPFSFVPRLPSIGASQGSDFACKLKNPKLIEFGGEGAADCRWGRFPQNHPDGNEEEQKSTIDRELMHARTRRADVIACTSQTPPLR